AVVVEIEQRHPRADDLREVELAAHAVHMRELHTGRVGGVDEQLARPRGVLPPAAREQHGEQQSEQRSYQEPGTTACAQAVVPSRPILTIEKSTIPGRHTVVGKTPR